MKEKIDYIKDKIDYIKDKIKEGSKDDLINRYCCLFSWNSLVSLVSYIIILAVGLFKVNKFTSQGHFFVLPDSLKNYNNSFSEVLPFAAIVSIIVFLVNEIKENNKKNNYISNFCRKLFGLKFKRDYVIKNFLFFAIILLVIIGFILLKYGENLADYKKVNSLIMFVYSIFIFVLFFITEIIIYYIKVNHKKIEINKSVRGLTTRNFIVNFINDPIQVDKIIEVIKLADSMTSLKNSAYMLLDIFSSYNYINRIEICERVTKNIFEAVVEFCEDKKYNSAESQIAFIINEFLNGDDKESYLLLRFFLISEYSIYFKDESFNKLSKNSKDIFFAYFPYIYLVYYDELNNKEKLVKQYKQLLIERKLELNSIINNSYTYSLLQKIIEYKYARNEIKSDIYFIFKKIRQEELYSLFVYNYIIFQQ